MKNQLRVYVYNNTVDNKKYVGATSMELSARAGKNGSQYRGSVFFYEAIRKYGWSAFKVVRCEEGLSHPEAAALEKKLIAEYKANDPEHGYNLYRGGLRLESLTERERKTRLDKIKASLRSQRSSDEVRAKMRERMLEVWSRGEQRSIRMAARKANPPGRPAVRAQCVETGVVYVNLKEASKAFGMCVAAISKGLKRNGGVMVLHTRAKGKEVVHLRRLDMVDVKRGELLE
jgi:hypothetical protein